MKKHHGMRPQDIVVLLKILSSSKIQGAYEKKDISINHSPKGIDINTIKIFPASNKDIAHELNLSASEVSESIHRSAYAGLIGDVSAKQVFAQSLLDFLQYGIKYAFPQRPGGLVRGIPTAHSAAPLDKLIVSDEAYVWEHEEGTVRGQAIEP